METGPKDRSRYPTIGTHTRQRLLGAVALVVIVVIVVPELLTGPRSPPPAGATPGQPLRTVTIDLAAGERGAIARAPPAAAAGTEPIAPATEPATAPATPATASAAAAPSTTAAQSAAAPAPAASASATAASAAAPVAVPDSGTPPASAPAAVAAAAPASTVKAAAAGAAPAAAPVGSTADRGAAAVAAGHGPPRPTAAAPGAQGWVVQLGSFAGRDNATHLVTDLRRKGYAAFVSEYHGSGRVLYRVRVGPEQDRGRVDAIAQRLAREGYRGSVAPQP